MVSATTAKSGETCEIGCTDAMEPGALETVLQQGCCPVPMLQSPAIFLQHAISDGVICVFGRQASAGIASQRASKLKTTTERQRTMTRCYPPTACRCKLQVKAQRVSSLGRIRGWILLVRATNRENSPFRGLAKATGISPDTIRHYEKIGRYWIEAEECPPHTVSGLPACGGNQ